MRCPPSLRFAAASVLLMIAMIALPAFRAAPASAYPLDGSVNRPSTSGPFRPAAILMPAVAAGVVGVVVQAQRIRRVLLAVNIHVVRVGVSGAPSASPANPAGGSLNPGDGNGQQIGGNGQNAASGSAEPIAPVASVEQPGHVPLSAETAVDAAAFAPIQSVEMLEPGQSGQVPIEGSPITICPVGVPHTFGDSFGAPRYAGGYHLHAGVDIFAEEGTPIYAPFDGVAEDASNTLGGRAVILRGLDGYVYNAHLSGFGTLGRVHTGDVIGYVGNSGDASTTSPHDHFEWHPNVIPEGWPESAYGVSVVGSAINPYPLLLAVC